MANVVAHLAGHGNHRGEPRRLIDWETAEQLGVTSHELERIAAGTFDAIGQLADALDHPW